VSSGGVPAIAGMFDAKQRASFVAFEARDSIAGYKANRDEFISEMNYGISCKSHGEIANITQWSRYGATFSPSICLMHECRGLVCVCRNILLIGWQSLACVQGRQHYNFTPICYILSGF